MKSMARKLLTAASAAMLWSAESPAHAGQSGNTFYVTGPNQDLVGSSGDDALGLGCWFPSSVMSVEDAQSLPDNLVVSGTWSGGDGFDEYLVCDGDLRVGVYSVSGDTFQRTTLYERETPIHATFDLDNIHIVDSGFNRFSILHQGPTRLDMQGKRYDVPNAIMHLIFDNIENFLIVGGVKNDTIQTPSSTKNIEVRGEDGDDFIIVRGDDNIISGEDGNDTLSSQGGLDQDVTTGSSYYGGPGDDNYMVFRSIDRFIEYPDEGFDTLYIYGRDFDLTTENAANMERVVLTSQLDENGNFFSYNINGSNGADSITGNGADNTINGKGSGDTLSGGEGDDTLTGDAPSEAAPALTRASAFAGGATPTSAAGGNDKLDGGSGTDTAVFSGQRQEYAISFSPSTGVITIADKVPGRDGTDAIRNVELFRFSDGTKTLANLFDMQADGTEGNDKITGNIGADKLYGYGGNDTIIGNGGNDEIDGGTGADIMSGGDGDDSYIVDNAGDKVKENARPGSGYDKVYTSLPSYTMSANVEELVYTGASAFSGNGNKSANRMTGGPAADVLDGRQGADVMIGLGGDDSYVVDSVADIVDEQDGGGTDTIVSAVGITTLSDNVEVLSLKKGNINGRGNALDNVILGSSGQNVLEGGDGADTLIGGLGNDTFYGETSASPGDDADTISYAGAKKAIVFSLSNTLAGQNTGGAGTDRIYDISSIEKLTGGSFNDTLTGNLGPNAISGADGDDTVMGLAGADVLVGGKGLDLIDCGADAEVDRLVYALITDSPVGTGRDQVTNFTPGTDLIDLSLIDANAIEVGDQAFTFAGTAPTANAVWYAVSGTDVILSGDVTGDAIADFEVLLKGVVEIHDADIGL